MFNYEMLPEGLRGGMQRYLERGITPGHFLTAVLENDLFGAVMRADSTNLSLISDVVKWVHSEVPIEACGSEEKIKAWGDKIRKEDDLHPIIK